MGVAQSALILLGIGIISSRFKAGVGLGELGTGIQTLVAAPLTGTGTGLSSFAGGLRDLAESLGDIGRGFSTLFESIPKLPTIPGDGLPGPNQGQLPSPPPPSNGGFGGDGAGIRTAILIPDGGGNPSQLLPGGGGNVPGTFIQPIILPPIRPKPVPIPILRAPIDINAMLRPVNQTRPISMVDDRLRNVMMI